MCKSFSNNHMIATAFTVTPRMKAQMRTARRTRTALGWNVTWCDQ